MNEAVRLEHDSLGDVEVPADALWGAQTQRSLEHFRIGGERMPRPLLLALAHLKRIGAAVNAELGLLDRDVARAVALAADEVLSACAAQAEDRAGR